MISTDYTYDTTHLYWGSYDKIFAISGDRYLRFTDFSFNGDVGAYKAWARENTVIVVYQTQDKQAH